MSNLVNYTPHDTFAQIEINRPQLSNALDRDTAEAFSRALDQALDQTNLRALAITASGRHFCVGGDLAYLLEHLSESPEEFSLMVSLWQNCISRLASVPVPVVVGVQGSVAGGGLGLLWAADYILATPELKIQTGFTKTGLSGDGGSSWYLPRLLGLARAKAMILDNQTLDAEQALEWGLINGIVDTEELSMHVMEKAQQFTHCSMTAIGAAKKLLLSTTGNSLEQQLKDEHEQMLHCVSSQDAMTGMRAFQQRETPEFTDC